MNFYLDKNLSMFFKGIAIILMVFHHAFAFPNWYINGISYPELSDYILYIKNISAIFVVPVFAFLTGWSYFFHKDKSYKYSLKKIIIFLMNYWIIYSLFLIIAIFICDYKVNIFISFLELIGIKREIMTFNWYVCFYIFIMLFLPMYVKYFPKKSFIIDILVIIFIEILIKKYLYAFTPLLSGIIANNLLSAIAGYLCAKYAIMENFYNTIAIIHNPVIRKVLAYLTIFLLLIIYTNQPDIFINLNIIYTIVFIMAVFCTKIYKSTILDKIFKFLSVHSMNIWFLHCIFFSENTRLIFQPIAYFLHIPILVIFWILFICLILSLILNRIQFIIVNKVNKLFL